MTIANDTKDLAALGYEQKLHRTMGSFTSFALAFSMVSINTGVIALFSDPFNRVGGIGVFLWFLVIPLVACIVAVYAHLSARIPVTGYAYQWSSRLVNKDYGWLTGWTAMLAFITGTAGTASAVGSVFAPEIWASPTQGNIQILSIAAILAVCLLNIIGIKIASKVNDIGAIIELVGTVILLVALVGGLLFFFGTSQQGVAVLHDQAPLSGQPVGFWTIALAMLLPVNVLLGWEGSADLAEETIDPRKSAASAMIRAVAISATLGVVMFGLLEMAIPGKISDLFAQPENPVINIVRQQFGHAAAIAFIFMSFASLFACLIANMAVATRMSYALSRDNMLPFSNLLNRVNPSTGTPVASIILITLIAVVLNLATGSIVGAIYSMVGLTYYLTYFLTLVATYLAYKNGRMPKAPEGTFDLGGWLIPVICVGVLWSICVIATFSIPPDSQNGAIATVIALAIGGVWWLVKLRGDLATGRAGPPNL